MVKFSLLIVSLVAISYPFIGQCQLNDCYLTHVDHDYPRMVAEKLPDLAEKFRKIKIERGEVTISRTAASRTLYYNEKDVPFINLKVELSDSNSYEADKKKLIEHLKYLNAHSTGMETKDLIELNFNGYKFIGLSRASIESGSTLGTFLMFPGNGIVVYFYFNNLKPEHRNFESVDDYKKLRDKFMYGYTKFLKTCL